MQCPNCKANLFIGLAPPDVVVREPNVIGGGAGGRIVDVGSGNGPYEGTGRDTTIADMLGGSVEDLAPATSVNKRTRVGDVVSFRIELKAGSFRAGLGEYGDAGNFPSDLALSRVPGQIEGAPARDPKNIMGVTIGDEDRDIVFGPGTWYLNVRVNGAGAEGRNTQGWTLSFYNNP